MFMQYAIQHSVNIGLFSLLITVAFGTSAALAQSGSAGGSIGNDEKSVSGSSRPTPRAAETEKPARRTKPRAEREEPRRAPQKSGGGGGGGGGGNFDGAWMVTSVGCGGTTTGAVVVTSGRIIADGVSGTVSPSGGVRTVGNFNGVSVTSSGHLSSRRGSGSFRRSDGCGGTWSSSKQ
jgi:hypothetical protein